MLRAHQPPFSFHKFGRPPVLARPALTAICSRTQIPSMYPVCDRRGGIATCRRSSASAANRPRRARQGPHARRAWTPNTL